jgi:hypothetical protein
MKNVFVRFESRPVVEYRIEDDFHVSHLVDMVRDKLMLDVPIDTLALYSAGTLLDIDNDVPHSSKIAPLVLKKIEQSTLVF